MRYCDVPTLVKTAVRHQVRTEPLPGLQSSAAGEVGPGRPADVSIGGFPRTALPNPACELSPHRALHMSRSARCGFPIPPSARAWGWPFPGIGTAWCVPRWG